MTRPLRSAVRAALVRCDVAARADSYELHWHQRLATLRQCGVAAEVAPWQHRTLASLIGLDGGDVNQAREWLEAADGALAQAAGALDGALDAAGEGIPPLQIATRIERVLRRLEVHEGDMQWLADEMTALIELVSDTWLPGIDMPRVSATLASFQPSAVASPPQPRKHALLAWAPIDEPSLLALAASALGEPFDVQAHATLWREQTEYACARHRVEQLLAAEPGLPATDVRLWTLRQELAREERELARATETVHHSIVRALGAYPPLAVQACAMAVRTAALLADVAVQPTFRAGSMVRVPTALHRALVTATMLALRRAADRACDGVLTMVAGNRGDGTRLVTHARLLVVDDASRALSEMGAAGVDAALASALAHVTMLGAVEHEAAEVAGAISWLDRLALWHDSDEELTHAQLRERARWHRAELELHLEYALATMGHVTRSLATCQLRDWLVALHDHAEAIDVTASDCMICSLNPSRDSAIEAARRCGAVLAAVGAPPPLIEQLQQVFEALRRVRSRRSQFRNSTNNTTSYSCRVIGHNAALDELRWWTWNLCAVVGTPPSNGDLLAWFLTQTANGGTAAEARPPC